MSRKTEAIDKVIEAIDDLIEARVSHALSCYEYRHSDWWPSESDIEDAKKNLVGVLEEVL